MSEKDDLQMNLISTYMHHRLFQMGIELAHDILSLLLSKILEQIVIETCFWQCRSCLSFQLAQGSLLWQSDFNLGNFVQIL